MLLYNMFFFSFFFFRFLCFMLFYVASFVLLFFFCQHKFVLHEKRGRNFIVNCES